MDSPPSATEVHVAPFVELGTETLYALLKLRVDVFVVEQQCAYPELDGRDIEPATVHVWIAELASPAEPLGYLRILNGESGHEATPRIGRVVVTRHRRNSGLADQLLRTALRLVGDRPCELDAQSHLARFYRRYGFSEAGPEFVEDRIPHVPMRRDPSL